MTDAVKRLLPAGTQISLLAIMVACAAPALADDGQQAARCTAIAGTMQGLRPESGTRITAAVFRAAGPMAVRAGRSGAAPPAVELPAHCDVEGILRERTGIDGQPYAIRFHLRLPAQWNGRFFFQGGGGTNGELGDAAGRLGGGAKPALAQGYAVVSQDSGHSNAINTVAARGGTSAFGFDPQARAEYGGASLKPVTLASRAIVQGFYGHAPRYSYFVGCSKGGQEGMHLAQRHPELFDGIVAAAPGFALPRAAVAEAWDTQAFAGASAQPVTLASLAASFSEADLGRVRLAILNACDGGDGLKDGIVGAFTQCTSAKVLPALRSQGLSAAQIKALQMVHEGPRNSQGKALYASFPWDGGWAGMGWRMWKIGSADGEVPAINVAMGAPSLAATFMTPPRSAGNGVEGYLAFHMGFDFNRDAPAIYATSAVFPRSAWEDIGARSPDLAAFHKRGGKLIVPHGVSDPVFSVNDSIAWWNEVNSRQKGKAALFTRVFPVPGMAHCGGGDATDQFDAFAPLVAWVEQGRAPDRIEASAGPASAWPGRQRPLCPYPQVAKPVAADADPEKSSSFACVTA